jgi:hypothetical protein
MKKKGAWRAAQKGKGTGRTKPIAEGLKENFEVPNFV